MRKYKKKHSQDNYLSLLQEKRYKYSSLVLKQVKYVLTFYVYLKNNPCILLNVFKIITFYLRYQN